VKRTNLWNSPWCSLSAFCFRVSFSRCPKRWRPPRQRRRNRRRGCEQKKGAERDMEAMVDMTCVGQEQIAQWLHAVASSRDAVVQTATQHLEAAHNIPQFPLLLLTLSAGRRRPSGSHLLHAHLWNLFLSSFNHTHTHTHTPMDCDTERWVVLSWHPKLCSNRTKPILPRSQQDTELGGLTDCFQNTQKSSTFSQV
jgi:hypothetical protein